MTTFTISNTGPTGDAGFASLLSWRTQNTNGVTTPVYPQKWGVVQPADNNESVAKHVITAPGTYTLRNLIVRSTGSTTAITYTIRINGVDTSITCTVAAGVLSGSDSTHTASVSQGDVVTCKMVAAVANSGNAQPCMFIEVAP
jgi:hypothetical protein